jgi:small subunit ribosomal protein S4
VNGKKVNVPSYLVKAGDVIAICEKSRSSEKIKSVVEACASRVKPEWISVADTMEAKIVNLPTREQIDVPIEEHLIVEFYSK